MDILTRDDFEFLLDIPPSETIMEINSPGRYIKTHKYLTIDVGFKNLSWCLLQSDSDGFIMNKLILEHGVESIYSKSIRKKIDWSEVNRNLHCLFTEENPLIEKHGDDLTAIYIEQQSFKNFKASLLASAIFTFFFNQAMQKNNNNTIKIEYLPSQHKYSSKTLTFLDCSLNKMKTYKERKKESIRRALNLLECECVTYRDNIANTIEDALKKDDLADSLLMAFYASEVS